ncbi:MAG: Stage V sporulation protein involved in spore cortex synthesis (SpoVR) [Candidatus Carbobacillus altaicus]|uniref:Stage V sporulation protein involved in spore cortex synthesis (SpoVR) n=1 Tax=Candidatus Carbonibacillus altaicus TaxID=2163959 RepID=A0A2R6Y465_9BACL|nr:MAG: Stage V sporulation protein involved in spore cortex synthesis (SpoVR) [Candidatus Carbobacillus altaicus]
MQRYDGSERRALERAIGEISEIARGFGLDFFPMRYEIVPADVMVAIGSYGMPSRFTHWHFGKAFQRMKLSYDLGLSKIYELVINTDPCYAFLYEGNALLQNKLIVAHVLAHSDFFKNNVYFSGTNRQMMESMANSAERIRHYERIYGMKQVEAFLDAVLSIQEHIDPYSRAREDGFAWEVEERPFEATLIQEKSISRDAHDSALTFGKYATGQGSGRYADLWALDARLTEDEGGAMGEGAARQEVRPGRNKSGRGEGDDRAKADRTSARRFPPEDEKDVLLFILRYSTVLEPWQRDVMTIVHDEMRYFWPQIETKIMNEGWATYWHQRIMRALDLSEAETIEYAKMNAQVTAPSRTSVNPYLLGLKIFEAIEQAYDNPTEEQMRRFGMKKGEGREKIFEVREIENDVSFLRNYLTDDVIRHLDLYVFAEEKDAWRITTKDIEKVRDALIRARTNGGYPTIVVRDGDFGRRGELLLSHIYDGTELDTRYIEKTLPYVHYLWGRPVHLETVLEGGAVRFSYNTERGEVTKEKIG